MKNLIESKNTDESHSERKENESNLFEGDYIMRIVGEVCIVVLGILFAILICHWTF